MPTAIDNSTMDPSATCIYTEKTISPDTTIDAKMIGLRRAKVLNGLDSHNVINWITNTRPKPTV